MTSPYSKAPFPRELYKRFVKVANKMGYKKRGARWILMDLMIQAAEDAPWMFEGDKTV